MVAKKEKNLNIFRKNIDFILEKENKHQLENLLTYEEFKIK